MTQYVTTLATILSRRVKKEPIAKGKTKTQCAGCGYASSYEITLKNKTVKLP